MPEHDRGAVCGPAKPDAVPEPPIGTIKSRRHETQGELYLAGAELVVNGGLTTLLLWEFAAARGGKAIKASSSRNVKALFVGRPMTLCGRTIADGKVHAWALDADGDLAIDAELELS